MLVGKHAVVSRSVSCHCLDAHLGDICRQQLRLVAVWLCLRTRIENSKDQTQPWNALKSVFKAVCTAVPSCPENFARWHGHLGQVGHAMGWSSSKCQEVSRGVKFANWSNMIEPFELWWPGFDPDLKHVPIPNYTKLVQALDYADLALSVMWKKQFNGLLSTGPISAIVLSKRSSSNLIYFLMKQNEEVLKEATKAQRQVTQVRESVGLMPSRSWEICPCFHLHTIYIGEKTVTMTVMKMALMLAKGYKMYWMDGWCFVMMTITIMIILYHNHNHDCDHRSVK